MSDVKKIAISWLFVLFCVSANSQAESKSTIALELGTDSESGQNHYVSGRYALDNGVLIKAATGESTSRDNTNARLVSSSYTAGIQSDPSQLVNLSFDISRSSQLDTIDIDTRIFSVDVNTRDWNLFISPEFRDISIQTITNKTIDLSSDGFTTGIGYYGWDPIYISIQYSFYDYSRNLSAISNQLNFFNKILGSDIVNQIYALEDDRTTIELGYYFENASVAISQSEGVSTVDQSISIVNKIYLGYKLDDNWSLGFSGGTSKINTSSGNTTFGNVNLNYRW